MRDWKAGENRYTIGFTRFVTAIYDRPVNNRGESPLTIRDWKAGENRYTIGFTRFVTAIYDRPVNNRGESPPTKKRKAFAFLFRVCIDYSM